MLREHQLPLEWFDVLVHLADLPGMRAHQKELQDRVLLSESGVSRLLVRMEKTGALRRSDEADRPEGRRWRAFDQGRAISRAEVRNKLRKQAKWPPGDGGSAAREGSLVGCRPVCGFVPVRGGRRPGRRGGAPGSG
jgi:MarR family